MRQPSAFVPFRITGSTTEMNVAENQILLYLSREATRSQIEAVDSWLSDNGIRKVGQIPQSNLTQYEAQPDSNLNPILEHLNGMAGVLAAIPNFEMGAQRDPNPNVGQTQGDGFYWVDSIRARPAWNVFDNAAIDWGRIQIGIVDDLVDNSVSSQLNNKQVMKFVRCMRNNGVVYFELFANRNLRECEPHTTPLIYHGTQVAAFASAQGDDGLASVGVAWNSPIVSVGVYAADGTTDFAAVDAGIETAIYSGAKVINLSIGFNCHNGVSILGRCLWQFDQQARWSLRSGLAGALRSAEEHDALVVIAAGNDGFAEDNVIVPPETMPNTYLRYYNNALFIGATSQNNCPAVFTASGSVVELSAPGDQIAVPDSNWVMTPGGGTSFSAPLVAGAAALVWSLHPTWTAQQVKQRLLDTARPVTNCQQIGHGILDVGAAVGSPTTSDAGVPDARTDAAVDVMSGPEVVNVSLTPTWGQGFGMDLVTRLRDGRAAIIGGNPNTRTETLFRVNSDGSLQNRMDIDLEGCGGAPQSLMEQSDGGFLLTCTYGGAQRVGSDGRIMWSFPYGMGPHWTIHATHQDNQVIRIVSNVMERGEVRLDGSGQAQFIRTWGTSLAPFGTNETVSIAEDGRVHALGLNIGDATSYIETLVTVNPSGQIDSRRMNTVPATRAYLSWFEPLSDGGVLQFNNTSPTVTNRNRQGVPRWSWASGRTDIRVQGCAEIGGRVFVSGVIATQIRAQPDAFWLAQLDTSGTLLWERTYRDTGRNVTYYNERSYLIPVTNGFLAAVPISPPGYGSVSIVVLPFDQEGRMR